MGFRSHQPSIRSYHHDSYFKLPPVAGGWPGAQSKAIETLIAQRKAKSGYVSSYRIARFYADLGDKDRAFDWLNTAYQERDFLMESLKTDFTLDSLHSDPRYAALVRKIGFPQQ